MIASLVIIGPNTIFQASKGISNQMQLSKRRLSFIDRYLADLHIGVRRKTEISQTPFFSFMDFF